MKFSSAITLPQAPFISSVVSWTSCSEPQKTS